MPETPQLPNGWNQWGNHVLKELERNELQHSDMTDKLGKMLTKMAVIETKIMLRSGLTGALTGLAVALAAYFLTK